MVTLLGGRQGGERRKQQVFLLGEVAGELVGHVGKGGLQLAQGQARLRRRERRELVADPGELPVKGGMVPRDDVVAERVHRPLGVHAFPLPESVAIYITARESGAPLRPPQTGTRSSSRVRRLFASWPW
jgi:hypothetical protein